jgi:hypothetical protein
MTTLNPEHVEWCRRHFATIKDGGTWALPGLGLIFIKRGNAFVLTARMPHVEGMPITAAQLEQRQQDLYEQTVEHFRAAGVEVQDLTKGKDS